MARKEKKVSHGPNQGYLISFGDTMTALLAFFIVMNSLAKDQTGADMHDGTGSFVDVNNQSGVPGFFDPGKSEYRLQLGESSPLYLVADGDEQNAEGSGAGPDEDGDSSWVRDREQEDYERFLIELERLQNIESLPRVVGEISFDRMNALASDGPLLDKDMREMVIPIAPRMRNPEYEVELVVWSPTPSKSAWTRTAEQAFQLRNEIVSLLKLTPQDASRFTAVSKPWMYRDVKRPILTLNVRKLESARPQ